VFLFSLLCFTQAQSLCGTDNPDCVSGDGVCCDSECRFTTLQCRASADDCDLPEFCTGLSSDCPPDDDAQAETPVAWDWVGNSGQLKVWVPVCDDSESASQWIKIKFDSLEEITDGNGKGGNLPSLNNLASQDFETRILAQNEIDDEFDYSPSPRDVAQITSSINVDGADLTFTITVMYFDEEATVSWTDSDSGDSDSYTIAANSVKFNIGLNGDWPWDSDTNRLRLNMDILWPSGKSASVSKTDASVSVDISSESLGASLAFPTGSLSPLIVDGEYEDVEVTATVQGSHVRVELIIPHFTESVTYDPYVRFNGASGIAVNFVALFSVLLCLFA